MAETDRARVTEKNLNRLSNFLVDELEQPELADQIPSGAHIFHGSYDDMELTQANLNLAATILMGMSLGLREEAPLVMLFEHKPGHKTVINLSTEERKRKVHEFAETFQEQNKQELLAEINNLITA